MTILLNAVAVLMGAFSAGALCLWLSPPWYAAFAIGVLTGAICATWRRALDVH